MACLRPYSTNTANGVARVTVHRCLDCPDREACDADDLTAADLERMLREGTPAELSKPPLRWRLRQAWRTLRWSA